MTDQVLVMPTAKRNLQHIFEWLAERSSRGASRLLTAFEDRLTTFVVQGRNSFP